MARTITIETVPSGVAQELVAAAVRRAVEVGIPMSIAVCDTGGILKAFLRMDGAPLLTVGTAQDKAYTAAGYGLPTEGMYDLIKDDPAMTLGAPHIPRIVVMAGGVPLYSNGQLVGGIGVSGGLPAQDADCGRAALEALGFEPV